MFSEQKLFRLESFLHAEDNLDLSYLDGRCTLPIRSNNIRSLMAMVAQDAY